MRLPFIQSPAYLRRECYTEARPRSRTGERFRTAQTTSAPGLKQNLCSLRQIKRLRQKTLQLGRVRHTPPSNAMRGELSDMTSSLALVMSHLPMGQADEWLLTLTANDRSEPGRMITYAEVDGLGVIKPRTWSSTSAHGGTPVGKSMSRPVESNPLPKPLLEAVFRFPVWLSVKCRYSFVENVPWLFATGKHRHFWHQLIRIFKRSESHGDETCHRAVATVNWTTAPRTERSSDLIAFIGS